MPIHPQFQNDSLKGNMRAARSERSFGRLHFTVRGSGGFSLVEVTMALGIMAFSFLVIFGLLGTGLTAFRQSKGVTVSSQIAQQIFAEVAVMPFNTLTGSTPGSSPPIYYQLPNSSIGGTTRYFDEQGNETTKTSAVYWANIRVLTSTPFVGAITVTNANLATVTIQVAYNPGGLPPDSGPSGGTTTDEWTGTSGGIPLQIYTYNAFVAQGS